MESRLSIIGCKCAVFSRLTQVKLIYLSRLGDSIAKAGYFVVMPDMFAGDAIPVVTDASFNMTAWRAKHTTDVVDAIINTTLNSMRTELGAKIIGGTGYW
jgi:dienelactone hydrolase